LTITEVDRWWSDIIITIGSIYGNACFALAWCNLGNTPLGDGRIIASNPDKVHRRRGRLNKVIHRRDQGPGEGLNANLQIVWKPVNAPW
jgi:hypothetical protein